MGPASYKLKPPIDQELDDLKQRFRAFDAVSEARFAPLKYGYFATCVCANGTKLYYDEINKLILCLLHRLIHHRIGIFVQIPLLNCWKIGITRKRASSQSRQDSPRNTESGVVLVRLVITLIRR